MDVLEILVLLIALVLIFLVVAVVLVVGQAMASKKEEEAAANGDAESEPSADAQQLLIQPAAAVPPIEIEEVAAPAPESQVQEPKQPDPVVAEAKVASPEVAEAKSAQPRSMPQSAQGTDSANAASHHEQTHRVHEERPVDSDRHNKFDQRRNGIMDDELRRPAVEAGNTRASQRDETFPYMSGGPLLSPVERLFYNDLKTSVSDTTEIFIKVRASDVVNPKSDLSFEEAQFAAEQLATQRFDFVLCDSKDFAVLCAIELDGLGDREGLRKIQREILRKAAESANVPVLLVDMKRGYTIKEIRDRVSYLLPRETAGFVAESHVGHHKRKIADLITEVDEPETMHTRQYAHSAFEEAENNSIQQFGNASHQHRPAAPETPRSQPAYHQDAPAHPQQPNMGTHNPFQEAFQQSASHEHEAPAAPQQPHHHATEPSGFEQQPQAPHANPAATPDPAAFAEGTSTKCPRCGSPLKMSMATTGEFAGRYFWICTNLPKCPYVAPITPPE